jgi:hypothetical protein
MFELFRYQPQYQTRCVNFENPAGAKGQAARENRGAKGHPCEVIAAGEKKTLLDLRGSGILTRIWLSFDDLSPQRVRAARLDLYWDGAPTPAVSAPLGDFFGLGLGRMAAFESDLFSNPEGRSFNSFVPMPFRTAARVVLTNEGEAPMLFFYEVNWLKTDLHPADVLYFHAVWNRQRATKIGEDFEVLPRVAGKGRYLGAGLGVITDPRYGETWWGEGEVKVYLDGDRAFPTLCNTGTEDYIGTAWGEGVFSNRYQGCTVADPPNRQWAFYRFHIPDPILFHQDCRVTLQQMGGAKTERVLELLKAGVPLQPVSAAKGQHKGFFNLLEMRDPPALDSAEVPNRWVNFYRSDDVSATAYFYLDRPENGLPSLAGPAERLAGLLEKREG